MTDYYPDVELQYWIIGFLFVAVIVINLGTHLFFLLKEVASGLCDTCKEKMAKCRRKKEQSQDSDDEKKTEVGNKQEFEPKKMEKIPEESKSAYESVAEDEAAEEI